MQALPNQVATVVTDLLALCDRDLPGWLEGFYLVGSLALGDFQPSRSDIDFVAVTRPGRPMAVIATIHAELGRRHPNIDCDGIYVTRTELSRPPDGAGPAVRAGVVAEHSTDERHPVTWLSLVEHGRVYRGQRPDRTWIAADKAAAIAYSRRNFRSYWRQWVEKRRRPDQWPIPDDEAIVWGALGIARLHVAIETGRIVSKSAAGVHALVDFPEHRPIITTALELRAGKPDSAHRDSMDRQRRQIAFMDAVLQRNSSDHASFDNFQ